MVSKTIELLCDEPLKQIVPTDVANKNACSARYNQSLFTFLQKWHWWQFQLCNLMTFPYFKSGFQNDRTPLWWTLETDCPYRCCEQKCLQREVQSNIVYILMEIALITVSALQFNEISVFQEWFAKWLNSFVMNPLHFLMSILLIHAIWLVWSPLFRFLMAETGRDVNSKCAHEKLTPYHIWRMSRCTPLVPVVNLPALRASLVL